VNGAAPEGVGQPPVNGWAPADAGAAWSSDIPVLQNGLIAMQLQLSAMLRMVNRLKHEYTTATAAAARESAACEPLRAHRLAWKVRGGLADLESPRGLRRPLALMLVDAAVAFQPRVALRSGGPEHEALGELRFLLGGGQAVSREVHPE
jgi:hypothetical protein